MTHVFPAGRLFNPDNPRAAPALDFRRVKLYPCLGLTIAELDADEVQALKQKHEIQAVRLGFFTLATGEPFSGAASPPKSWNLGAVKLDLAGYTGRGVTVGLLDSGVDTRHTALQKTVKEWAYVDINGGQVTLVTQVSPGDADRTNQHGTRVAGVICGRPFMDQVGTAPDAQLSVVRLGGATHGAFSDEVLIETLAHFCSTGVKLCNLSIDAGTEEASHELILRAAVAAGILPIVPIGNDGQGKVGVPGKCDSAVGVGAVAVSARVWPGSGSEPSKGPATNPDLLAPGEGIWTCCLTEDDEPTLSLYNGTSFAAPHITGLAARILEMTQGQITSKQLIHQIYRGCPPSAEPNRAARGVPDATVVLK
jgi:subtilisin family serine protease